ncbi:MAG TPA: hypothetical protein PKD64_12450 [Pirellulaceae bacterium]|nr:hypothetical protein [Pirellulaceae bacterium]HMO92998.1 hypothetical protein [Pirellulaceae bacterium]HMP67924.1 hypothetical protein [Pirellulaceae bacterium]
MSDFNSPQHQSSYNHGSFNANAPLGQPNTAFPIKPIERLQRAFDIIKPQYWMFFLITFVALIIGGAVPFGILLGAMYCGMYMCYRELRGGNKVAFETLFKGFDHFAESIKPVLIMVALIIPLTVVFYILFFVAMIGGVPPLVFLVTIPLIYVAILLCSALIMIPFTFVFPLIVERKMNGIEALKLSWATSKQMFFPLFKFYVICLLISLVASLCCVVPAYLFAPIMFVSVFTLYEDAFNAGGSQPLK